MKKFGKFLKDVFTKNIGIKILAIVLAAIAVALINIVPAEKEKTESESAAYVVCCQNGETNESN